MLVGAALASHAAQDAPPRFAPPGDATEDFAVEPLIGNLAGPCGLVLRPGSPDGEPPELFFSEAAAGRVMRLQLGDELAAMAAVEGFPTRPCDALGGAHVGPLGLAFLTRTKLAVGEAGLGPGADLVRVYVIDAAAAAYDAVDATVGPITAGRRPAEGAFFGLALLEDGALFATALAAESKETKATKEEGDQDDSPADEAFLLKATVDANQVADLQRFVQLSDAGGSHPTAVTLNPNPDAQYLLVGLQGRADDAADSAIAFYSPHSGRQALTLPCGLRDVVALAYSPRGQLYAADASWADPAAGGIYRIDAAMIDGRQACRPVKIAAIVRPVSLAFGGDGNLYAAAWGAAGADAAGEIVRITGAF
ncbi:MAG: hypothetical protein KDA44_12485 [Planctomycetales bacterium]|nr:hypothetical protein [Planctomycetales bacterium]